MTTPSLPDHYRRLYNFIVRNPQAVVVLWLVSLMTYKSLLQNMIELSIFLTTANLLINLSDQLDDRTNPTSLWQQVKTVVSVFCKGLINTLPMIAITATLLSVPSLTYPLLMASSILPAMAFFSYFFGLRPLVKDGPTPVDSSARTDDETPSQTEELLKSRQISPNSGFLASILRLNERLPIWVTVPMNLMAYRYLSIFMANVMFVSLVGMVINAMDICSRMQEDTSKPFSYVEFTTSVTAHPITISTAAMSAFSGRANACLFTALTTNCMHAIYHRNIKPNLSSGTPTAAARAA